ncbi:sensor histidine kinase [Listeria costaricensis]|uniref:sensor histidine kinase n=1 Tax=Listeria costaricensis TaxID=2026604 RepID=UPI000C07DABC|nr:sensor histidine kinase KdpD [Listeria costaricensis]
MERKAERPNPDALLGRFKNEIQEEGGKLKIYFGYAAGVGKTYAMLNDAREQAESGRDVVIGYLEPHARPETLELAKGLETLSPKKVLHRNIQLTEFDLDGALARKPELILVDELAHTNAEEMRNKKRYQDIEELLAAGIDVYTTVNVQHIESLNDIIAGITQIVVQETIPDQFFDQADTVKLIDIDPDELLKRLAQGKIYQPDRAGVAMRNFFTKDNLKLLREIALRKAADRISFENSRISILTDKFASMKLLVCIGLAPSSSRLIRWGARAAEAFHAPWTVLYVDDGDTEKILPEEKRALRENLELAERLGAEIVTLNGDNLAETIAEYAKQSGVTDIVVGKSRRKRRLIGLWEEYLEDQIISEIHNIEIHIIPAEMAVGRKAKSRRRRQFIKPITWHDTAKMMGLLVLATLVSLGLSELGIGDQNVIMVYILSVLIISRITEGYLYGVLGSLLGVLLFNFFFTTPVYTFNTIQAGYPVTFAIMLIVALVTSALTVRIKKQAKQAVAKEHRTEVLYEINKQLLVTRNLAGIAELTNDYVARLFGRSAVFFLEDPLSGHAPAFQQVADEAGADKLLTEDEQAVAHWVFKNKKRAGAGTDTLMGAMGHYMPVISQGQVLGVLGVYCLKEKGLLTQDNRLFLRMITSQVAIALERQKLSDEQRTILIEAEKEKMRGNLLRAISHDLRTPLTGILGASSAILENTATMDDQTKTKLVHDIKDDSEWLIRMVENLLSITRINEGLVTVDRTEEIVEEVAAEAVGRIKQRFPDREIYVKVPDEPLFVPMDGTLIVQVLINLIENALRHGGETAKVWLEVGRSGEEAVFTVRDDGIGIPPAKLPHLFDGLAAGEEDQADRTRGLGIGLSICYSIVRAHQGRMAAYNQEAGGHRGHGAVFWFSLPLAKGGEQNGTQTSHTFD